MKTRIGVVALLTLALLGGQAHAQDAAATGPVGTPPAQAATQAQQQAEADALIKRGTARIKAGDNLGAYEDFVRAHALKRSWKSGGNGGHVACSLNKFAESVALFRDGLSLMPPDYQDYDRVQAKFKRRMAECAAQAGTLRFAIAPAGAQLLVDGKAVGTAPLAEPVYVDAGKREVEVRLAGHETAKLTVAARAGSEITVALTLTEASTAAGAAGADADAADGGGVNGLGVAGVVVGGVGMALGVGLLLAAAGELNDADDLTASIAANKAPGEANPCGAGEVVPSECAALKKAADAGDSYNAAGISALVAGGLLAAGGVLVLLLDSEDSEEVAAPTDVTWQLAPLVGDGQLGWVVGGTF